MGQPVGQLKECNFLTFSRLETAFDQFDDDPVREEASDVGE